VFREKDQAAYAPPLDVEAPLTGYEVLKGRHFVPRSTERYVHLDLLGSEIATLPNLDL
jgi:hypothetical protein